MKEKIVIQAKITRVEERIYICLKTKLQFKVILKLKLKEKESKSNAVGGKMKK